MPAGLLGRVDRVAPQMQAPERVLVRARGAVVAIVTGIHYEPINDLAWSSDGSVLVVASKDGYCTAVTFADHSLGEHRGADLFAFFCFGVPRLSRFPFSSCSL